MPPAMMAMTVEALRNAPCFAGVFSPVRFGSCQEYGAGVHPGNMYSSAGGNESLTGVNTDLASAVDVELIVTAIIHKNRTFFSLITISLAGSGEARQCVCKKEKVLFSLLCVIFCRFLLH